MATWRGPVASQHQPHLHPHLLSVQHDHLPNNSRQPCSFIDPQQYIQRFTFQPQLSPSSPPLLSNNTTRHHVYTYMQQYPLHDDTAGTILSETEQKAFSEFLNQLSTDDVQDSPTTESEESFSSYHPTCEDLGQRGDANFSSGYSSTSSSIQYGYPHSNNSHHPNATHLKTVASDGTACNANIRSKGLRRNDYEAGNGKYVNVNDPSTHFADDGSVHVKTNDAFKTGAFTSRNVQRRQSSLDTQRNSNDSTSSSHAKTTRPQNESAPYDSGSAPATPSARSPSSRPATPSSPVYSAKRRAPGNVTNKPTRSRPSKPAHELLTESEKKANHIASEQRRRQNIRTGFDALCDLVPTLTKHHRSEALILQKSIEHIQNLLTTKKQIKERIRYLREMLGEPLEADDNSGSDDGGPEDDGGYY